MGESGMKVRAVKWALIGAVAIATFYGAYFKGMGPTAHPIACPVYLVVYIGLIVALIAVMKKEEHSRKGG